MNHFKKTSQNLNKLRGIFFQLGLVIACGLSLLAFEWSSPITFPEPDPIDDVVICGFTGLPPVTVQDDEPKKPQVKINQPPVIIDVTVVITDGDEDPNDNPLPNFNPDNSEPTTPTTKTPPPPKVPFRIVETMPQFVGGEKGRVQFLEDNIKYPGDAKAAGIEGTVYLQFVINKKGEVTKVKVLRGVSNSIDKEAVRVLKAMPNWSPGKQRKRPVNVILNMPIKFELR